MSNIKTANVEVEKKLGNDLEHFDEIIELTADLLYELESHIALGSFDPDTFVAEIERKFRIDDTRRMMLERAMRKYKNAIESVNDIFKNGSKFARTIRLNFSEYDSIVVKRDRRWPGVIILKVTSREDAIRLALDTEPISRKKLRALKGQGAGVDMGPQGLENWRGKFIPADNLFFHDTDAPPIIGAIAVYDDRQGLNENFISEILTHEYAHAQYDGLLRPFVHQYFSARVTEEKNREGFHTKLSAFSQETRKRIDAALDVTHTYNYEKMISNVNRMRGEALGNHDRLSLIDEARRICLDEDIELSIVQEQNLLDELRAYGHGSFMISPNSQITNMYMGMPDVRGNRWYIDEKMAQSYLKLHMLVCKTYLINTDLYFRALCLLGASQTLNQAIRLVGNLIAKRMPEEFDSKRQFDFALQWIVKYDTDEFSGTMKYQIGEASISKDEVIRTFLPTRKAFEEGVEKFYDGSLTENALRISQLYGRLDLTPESPG